ncbi:hypothetical protein GCM10009846_12920 [Agrococcus versicolor]|uniref:N-acetyltransferase domain-containing protein n=1 Tax=Agrococcus versicolor TaxID=501482 RepID=A0ABP5MIU4_9MICO
MIDAHAGSAIATPTTAARALADEACAAAGITMVDAADPVATQRVAAVLSAVWSRQGAQIMDPAMLVAIAHAGNLVCVALEDDVPVGAAAGFCGPPGSPFHSHIVGLLETATGRGLGRAIKLYQRAWCLEHGIRAMSWTYDPLVARNAYFNLRRLGARATSYHPDFYGVMTDVINAGQRSDRMVVRWDLDVEPPPAGPSSQPDEAPEDAHVVLADVDGEPSAVVLPGATARTAVVAVPRDVEAMRRVEPQQALRWRDATRDALSTLLADGWTVVDFTRTCQYVLHREGTP